jgi:hypothetical protein
MSEIYISEEQFNKFHHWIRIASAKEHSEFHRELTKLGLQEQFWLKQIIGHSEVINNYEIVGKQMSAIAFYGTVQGRTGA